MTPTPFDAAAGKTSVPPPRSDAAEALASNGNPALAP